MVEKIDQVSAAFVVVSKPEEYVPIAVEDPDVEIVILSLRVGFSGLSNTLFNEAFDELLEFVINLDAFVLAA